MSLLARAKRQGPKALVVALLTAAALATAASAYVSVYGNPFSSRSQYKEIVRVGSGDACKRDWVKKRTRMRIELGEAPGACLYTPPVQGDNPKPDHRFDLDGRIMMDTAQQVRGDAYLSLAVRVGGGDRYELRIFPKEQRFELRRQPNSAGFPVTGTDPAIEKIGERNEIRLVAEGNQIRAFVNGAPIADVPDVNANDLTGARLEFGVGSEADSNRATVGVVERLKVAVPTP